MATITGKKFSADARLHLAGAGSYREFLRIYFEETGLSYAEVARRAGFSSRSYPRDVTEARRRLTAKSLPSLLRGLRLEPDLYRVLQLLYFSEYPEEHPEALAAPAIHARLEKERQRAKAAHRKPVRKKTALPASATLSEADLTPLAAGLTDILAAFGKADEGATLEEIQRRTGTSKALLAARLDSLVEEGLVAYRGDSRRFVATTWHLDWTGQAGSRLAKAIYGSSVERLGRAAQNHFANADALFLNSALSIPRKQLPRLKKELREVILRFVDQMAETEDPQDTIVQIVTGLFEARIAPPLSQ